MRTVLPGAGGRATTRLGFGLATLMREPSYRKRCQVLEAAYEVGYRHFDVAPLYGLGRAEAELGRFLARTGSDASVATKFGLKPSPAAAAMSRIQRPVRAALKKSDMLTRVARRYTNSAVRLAAPTVNDVADSLEASLVNIGVSKIDLLLMHDMPWNQDWACLWGDLNSERFRGAVEALGISGSSADDLPYPSSVLAKSTVLQLPSNSPIQQPPMFDGDAFSITFGLLAKYLSPMLSFLRQDDEVRSQLEELILGPLRNPPEIASFLAAMNLAKVRSSILLVGTTSPEHAVTLWQNVEKILVSVELNRDKIVSILAPMESV